MAKRPSGGRDYQTLRRRVLLLEAVCDEAYELARVVGAPSRALANLRAAATGGRLPYSLQLQIGIARAVAAGAASLPTPPGVAPAGTGGRRGVTVAIPEVTRDQ